MSLIICPDCQHQFEFDSNRDFVFCEKCGRRIELAPQTAGQPAAEPAGIGEQTIELSGMPAPEQPGPESMPGKGYVPEPVPVDPSAYPAEPQPQYPQQQVQPVPQPMQPPVPQPMQPAPQPMQPAPRPMPQAVSPVSYPAQEKFEPAADLSVAIKCYNARDYKTANECLKLLKESEPDNFEIWFCACKVLAAEKPADIKTALDSYIEAAGKCLALAPEGTEVRGNLTLEFNKFIKTITDAIIADMLYITPYDRSVMSVDLPSANYQPLLKVDEFYFMIMDCIGEFRAKVNPNYLDNYFLGLWDNCFFCFAHEITQRMVTDFNSSKFFGWYKSDQVNRVTNEAVFNAMCDLLFGYKNVFITLFNRLPFKDERTKAVNRIAYINKWLLRMRRTDQTGQSYLLIAQPSQRTELDQETRQYKIMLSQS